jgi:hypothetical protein
MKQWSIANLRVEAVSVWFLHVWPSKSRDINELSVGA